MLMHLLFAKSMWIFLWTTCCHKYFPEFLLFFVLFLFFACFQVCAVLFPVADNISPQSYPHYPHFLSPQLPFTAGSDREANVSCRHGNCGLSAKKPVFFCREVCYNTDTLRLQRYVCLPEGNRKVRNHERFYSA